MGGRYLGGARRMHPLRLPLLLLTAGFVARLWADGPADNVAENVRRIPPPGVEIPDADREELVTGVVRLGAAIDSLRTDLEGKPASLALLPDIQIFHKAVDWALRYDEFFRTNEVDAARQQLAEGERRAAALRAGSPDWTTARGLVVRGYVSRVDGSVQPYGLVVPESYDPGAARVHRLDAWFHGRGEQLGELAFLHDRRRNVGEFAPPGAFVLHLYGRYCNGSRFAGETDFWEALDDVRRRYPIDPDRLVVRGFSLGGASCWHMAVHHAWQWAAAAPGAGFSETAEFLRVFQDETLRPQPWEPLLWRLYDATSHAANVAMVPLVAYSGEKDRQIQAARAMEAALAAEGMRLSHVIGPDTGHRYEPGAKAEINRRIDALAARGRDPVPRTLQFVTHSLRYPRMAWFIAEGLARHWEPARVAGVIGSGDADLSLTLTGVTAFRLEFGPGEAPFPRNRSPVVRVEPGPGGAEFVAGILPSGQPPETDGSWGASYHLVDGVWRSGPRPADGLAKRTGLQGPIDDAFMDSFLMVLPGAGPMNPVVGAWVDAESARAREHWRRHFRGEPRVKLDDEVTEADMAAHHLVLWGDPQSNRLLGRLVDRLPIRWDATAVRTPDANYPSDRYAPVLIHPNPLHPDRYVVVNSGFTFREYDYLNNARQTPKLPDWAVIDLRRVPDSRQPGGIAAGGFFGERWEWTGAMPPGR